MTRDESGLIKAKHAMIKTHACSVFFDVWNLKSVCVCHETKHLSKEFTNGSSFDATGNNWRFEAENLRQITIYQLMKPLKIIFYPPVPSVLRTALLTHALAKLKRRRKALARSHHFATNCTLRREYRCCWGSRRVTPIKQNYFSW